MMNNSVFQCDIRYVTFSTVDLGNFVPLFNLSLCSMSSISPKR